MIDFVQQVLQGKTIGRILMNRLLQAHAQEVRGKVLDLAGNKNASYYRYLPHGLDITAANYQEADGVDVVVDFNKPLSFADGEFDTIFLFNALYISSDRSALYSEIRRVLKDGSKVFIVTPLIANEMPEPHDYCRLTYEGLERELSEAGFSDIKITRFGERFSAAAQLLHPAFLFSIIRLLVYPLALLLDKLIPARIKKAHPSPIGYFVVAKK